MSAGIPRIHGMAEVGTSLNVTGRKSTFIGGYQPLFVKVQTVTASYPFATVAADGADQAGNYFDKFIRACETVGTVVGYSTPSTTEVGSSSTVVVIFDAGSVNQGDGTGGQSGATTGFAALKAAIVGAAAQSGSGYTIVASDLAVTTYTGLTGSALSA